MKYFEVDGTLYIPAYGFHNGKMAVVEGSVAVEDATEKARELGYYPETIRIEKKLLWFWAFDHQMIRPPDDGIAYKQNLKLEHIGLEYGGMGTFALGCASLLETTLGADVIGIPPKYNIWVAEITGFSLKYKFKRAFLTRKIDWTHSNSKGSRGIFHNFILEYGKIYDVKALLSWKRVDRYYCRLDEQAKIIRMEAEEVVEWLREHLV